jgi:hypothetical protein
MAVRLSDRRKTLRIGGAARRKYREAAGAFAKAVIRSLGLVRRGSQRSFVYLVALCVLDPNLRPLAPPLIRFENGVAEIIGKYFGDVFFALDFDLPSHNEVTVGPRLRLSLAIPYRAFELSQYAIEYETRIPVGIFVRHFSIHAQKRIAIFFE